MTSPPVQSVMPPDMRDKVFRIRCRSKEGYGPSDEEMRQLLEARRAHPADYAAMDAEVFEATKPFGNQP